jgi:dipeptidyl-peptidase-3
MLLPVLDEKGDICDIQINYSESYAHQMLRYSSEYGTLI